MATEHLKNLGKSPEESAPHPEKSPLSIDRRSDTLRINLLRRKKQQRCRQTDTFSGKKIALI